MKRYLRVVISLVLCISFLSTLVVYSSAALLGDLNGDREVTTEDAHKILKIVAGQVSVSASEKALADMNGDGIISLDDAREALFEAIGVYSEEEYTKILLEKGFPKSYIEDIVALYIKYPKWDFEPLITGLDWNEAVEGEHTPHNKQLIENSVIAAYKCSCSQCKGVIQEAGGWVSASKTAVETYLDPRNFLTESHIFQFEYNVYSEAQSIRVIESILKGTWMYDSYITYHDGLGDIKTFKLLGKKMKYSEAILKAARDSGLSAYYLASKIVQEVGSAESSYAAGASGTSSPYDGIYNYYNIGAYTGAGDGLRWANGHMKTTAPVTMYSKASTSSSVVCSVPEGVTLYYISERFGFYRVSAVVGGTRYSGFVPSSAVSVISSYGRPWSNPYKSIYYGAQYIYDSFAETQPTGYLQKFNVNPASENLYSHEYMANIRAAAFESEHTYEAYSDCGILAERKVFLIPVFENMPNGDVYESERFTMCKPVVSCNLSTSSSITLTWTPVEGALGYQVFKYDAAKKDYVRKNTANTTYTDTKLTPGKVEYYLIRAYKKDSAGKYIYTDYCEKFLGVCAPDAPTKPVKVTSDKTSVTIKWKAVPNCSGYYIYRYDVVSGAYKNMGATTSAQFKDSGLLTNTTYRYKVRAYNKTKSMVAPSSYSPTLEINTGTTTSTKVGVVNVSDWLNVRSEPKTDATIITKVTDGFKLYIIGTSGEWYKVTFTLDGKNYTGYVHSDYVTVSGVSQKETCPYAEPTQKVCEGDKGEAVKWVQWYLYKSGYLSSSGIDGDFGPTTLSAVKSFQSDKGITADGVVGTGTRTALKNAYK